MPNDEITIVSGLPRSGTSLMMQMLERGGMPIVIDEIRAPDTDNPRGYHEFEVVKTIKNDTSWVPNTRGKAFKMVSQLLYHLPANERYKIVFMKRDFDEMLESQEKMLARLGRPAAPRDAIKRSFTVHLEHLENWLAQQPFLKVCYVRYNELMQEPEAHAKQIADFLDGRVDAAQMTAAVDPSLYRNRGSAAGG